MNPDGAAAEPVGFTLRPTQDSGAAAESGLGEPWSPGQADEPATTSALGAEIGPPLAGPEPDDPIGPPLAGPEPPQPPTAPRRQRREEEDPYAARGMRFGPFLIRPSIEIGVAATDNASGGSEGDAATGAIVAPEVLITGGGARWDLDASARGEALLYGDKEIDERDAEARVALGYEPTRSTRLEAEAGYSYSLDSYTDPDTPSGATERPAVHDLDASLAATQRVGRVGFTLRGTVERSLHDEVPLSGGGVANRDELDNVATSVAFRAAYEAGALSPFVEAEAGWRDYDVSVDSNGFRRSSRWTALTGGLAVDFGAKLNGEISAGWYREEPDDPALDDIEGVKLAASLLWSPRRLTNVRLDLSTSVEPTTLADASGSIVYSGELSVERRMRSGWGMEAGIGAEYERFVGVSRDETTYSGFVGTSYAFNRRVSVAARYTHERIDSSEPDGDSQENRVELRLRLQH